MTRVRLPAWATGVVGGLAVLALWWLLARTVFADRPRPAAISPAVIASSAPTSKARRIAQGGPKLVFHKADQASASPNRAIEPSPSSP